MGFVCLRYEIIITANSNGIFDIYKINVIFLWLRLIGTCKEFLAVIVAKNNRTI